MYAPLPPRPRKTNISRSKNGCVPGRRKKRKVDGNPVDIRRTDCLAGAIWLQPDTPADDCSASYTILEPASPSNEKKQLSLQDNPVDMTTEQLYISYFTQELMSMLPESIRAVASRMTEPSGVREAAIALSAARLASIESEPQLPPLRRPRLQHFSEALSRFIAAVQQIRSHPTDIENVLAAVIHLVLFELEVGTLWGGRYLQRLVDEIAQPREIIYINMTRAVSITTRLILAYCMQHDHKTWHIVAGKVYSRFQDISMQPAVISILPQKAEGEDIYLCLKELEERNRAVIFHSGYEPLNTTLPKPRESSPNKMHSFLNIPNVNPIRFDQCEDAIFYAVYAPHRSTATESFFKVYSTNKKSKNMNISWVLVLLALRWPTQEVMTYLKDDFLPRLQRTDTLRGDTVGPLPSFSRIVNVLDTETKHGRRIYTMQPVYADSTKREHFFLMNQVEGYAIHGRDSAGHFFNDYIST
ncbi:hypothetical protein BDV36DRAFT_296902 [Aspergillus pseudocaelatus]|uniref:Uncharacterized protein n=1 Tax=Aspergillus pseudocaelatus TaxID=1825620 RepID=A0ABQ6WHK0_9EURO|nr:hypothetical protein BDV36DRAFT_296902 [Aspergillus pseudocaelatus]